MKTKKPKTPIFKLCEYCNGRREYLLVTEYQKCIWCNGRGIRLAQANLNVNIEKMKRPAKRHVYTLVERLNQLPEPYRTKAISYAKETDLDKPLHISCKDVADSLFSAFQFDGAPEGGDYWYDYYRSLKNK